MAPQLPPPSPPLPLRPTTFEDTVAVHDADLAQVLFKHRLLSAVYSKRPPDLNSKKRKLHEMRKQVPDVDALARKRKFDLEGTAETSNVEPARARALEKQSTALDHLLDDGALDRPSMAMRNYKAIVVMPLRMTHEEARLAALEGIIHLRRASSDSSPSLTNGATASTVWKAEARPTPSAIPTSLVFTFPQNSYEQRSALVFEDLWRKGWIITRGSNFGCDFMIYTSDPGTSHARFMICIVDEEMEEAATVKLTSITALATKVRKRALLARVSDDALSSFRTATSSSPPTSASKPCCAWTPGCVSYTLVEGCLFRRSDFMAGRAEEANAKKQKRSTSGTNKRSDADADDELGVRTSVAV